MKDVLRIFSSLLTSMAAILLFMGLVPPEKAAIYLMPFSFVSFFINMFLLWVFLDY